MAVLGVIDRYRPLLNIPEHTQNVTLLEGSTPLIPVPRIADELGKNCRVWVKFEGLNPTGSFKDRGPADAPAQPLSELPKSWRRAARMEMNLQYLVGRISMASEYTLRAA